MRDTARATVYAVEDAWSRVLDRGGQVDFFGSHLDVPMQRRFGDLAAMQAYADHWLRESAVVGAVIDPVRIRRRKGARMAHYEPAGVIAIPIEADWACTEAVLLHELAHHAVHALHPAAAAEPHGPGYRGTMCWLVEQALGPQAGLLLRSGYQGAGLEVRHVA